MSTSYKKAISNIVNLTDSEAMQVCIEIAKSSPSILNAACLRLGLGECVNSMNITAKSMVDSGRKMDAIKLVRNNTNMGVRDAKEYVESL